MTANNKIAAVGAAVAASAAVTGAATESLPILAVAAAVGIAATSIKLVVQHRRQMNAETERRRSTQPIARVQHG